MSHQDPSGGGRECYELWNYCSFPRKCSQLSSSIGVEHWMWRWWLLSTNISSLLYLHISDVFRGVLLVGAGGKLGHPEVLSFFKLLRQWVHPYPVLGPLLTYLAWTSVVFMFDFLELRLRVKLWLALEWAFAFLQIGPMSFIFYLGPPLPCW